MIHVIMQAEENHSYITRYVNSVTRQTYRDFKMAVVHTGEVLANAIENSKGEHILFLNGNEILPANAFEKS